MPKQYSETRIENDHGSSLGVFSNSRTGRTIDIFHLKRQKTTSLNQKFDSMVEKVRYMNNSPPKQRSRTHPRRASYTPGSSSIISSDTSQTLLDSCGTQHRFRRSGDSADLKNSLNNYKSPKFQSEGARSPQGPLPEWLSHTFSNLEPAHPLRMLVPDIAETMEQQIIGNQIPADANHLLPPIEPTVQTGGKPVFAYSSLTSQQPNFTTANSAELYSRNLMAQNSGDHLYSETEGVEHTDVGFSTLDPTLFDVDVTPMPFSTPGPLFHPDKRTARRKPWLGPKESDALIAKNDGSFLADDHHALLAPFSTPGSKRPGLLLDETSTDYKNRKCSENAMHVRNADDPFADDALDDITIGANSFSDDPSFEAPHNIHIDSDFSSRFAKRLENPYSTPGPTFAPSNRGSLHTNALASPTYLDSPNAFCTNEPASLDCTAIDFSWKAFNQKAFNTPQKRVVTPPFSRVPEDIPEYEYSNTPDLVPSSGDDDQSEEDNRFAFELPISAQSDVAASGEAPIMKPTPKLEQEKVQMVEKKGVVFAPGEGIYLSPLGQRRSQSKSPQVSPENSSSWFGSFLPKLDLEIESFDDELKLSQTSQDSIESWG